MRKHHPSPAVEKTILSLPQEPGTYLLMLESKKSKEIRIGKLGTLQTHPGFYFYVGSALGPGGLRARIGHHLRRSTRHWHIDYLKWETQITTIWYLAGLFCYEHLIADILYHDISAAIPLSRFGASDCSCPSHLFFRENKFELAVFLNDLQKRTDGAVTRAVVTEIKLA